MKEPGLGFRIDRFWAFVAVHEHDDDEGLMAFMTPNGVMMAMIAADQARLEQLTPIARDIGRKTGRTFRLVQFQREKVIEVFHPDGRRTRPE